MLAHERGVTAATLGAMNEIVERRFHRRIPVGVTVRVEFTGLEFVTETANLSAGGVFLSTERNLPVGTRVKLRIDIPIIAKYPVRAGGEVTRCGGEPPGMAIRFLEINDEDRALLVELAERSDDLIGR